MKSKWVSSRGVQWWIKKSQQVTTCVSCRLSFSENMPNSFNNWSIFFSLIIQRSLIQMTSSSDIGLDWYAFYSRVTKENAHAKSNSVEWLSSLKEVVSNNSLIFMIEGRERLYDNPKLTLNSDIFHNHEAEWKEIRRTRKHHRLLIYPSLLNEFISLSMRTVLSE